MTNSVSVKVLPQFVETSDEMFNGRRLHKTQQALLHFDGLPEFTIMTAPTGTGKSFAFPLPIIQHRSEETGFSKRRGIIISPTNALIEDMVREYSTIFPDISVSKLNRSKLDELNAKGPERWNALIQIITDNEIIITNPDLLNFALFGGYFRYKGQKEINEIFARIDYFVFDEYHLYDEEQIANILSWIIIKKALINKPVKFIFASATPEKKLREVLSKQGSEVTELVETVSEFESDTSRKIHGEIEVTFLKGTNLCEYALQNAATIKQWIKHGERVLIIFDTMLALRKARSAIEKALGEVTIAEVSGYFTKTGVKKNVRQADLILGTNKVEVGVNLDVTICLMQPGKNFANFVQRFGRVARAGKNGKIIIFLENKIHEIEVAFNNIQTNSYYQFMEICAHTKILSERNFYSEKVPRYLGAYFFIIGKNIRDYATRKLFHERIKPEGETAFIFAVMRTIDKKIKLLRTMNSHLGRRFEHDCKNWEMWWMLFLDTFRYFRPSAPDVLVRDLMFDAEVQIVRYSLEWILRNREIVGEESFNGERCLVVSNFLDARQELQYYVESLPVYKLLDGTLYLQQKEKYILKQAFQYRFAEIAKMYRNQSEFDKAARFLICEIEKLQPIISEKRLLIKDVKSFSNIF